MKTNTWAELGRITNYDFAKVRNLVVDGYVKMCRMGYDNFIAQIELDSQSNNTDKLTITFWTMDGNGTPKSFCAEQQFYGLINIPHFISEELSYRRKYEVRLTKEDLRTIYDERGFEINTSDRNLDEIVRRKLLAMGVCHDDISLEITSNAIYYKVKVYTKDSHKFLFEMLSLNVNGLQAGARETLDEDHSVNVNI